MALHLHHQILLRIKEHDAALGEAPFVFQIPRFTITFPLINTIGIYGFKHK
jgi:hypothetical protein